MSYEHEAGRLRSLASSGANVWYTRHAETELANDDIAKLDVENMLRRCSVALVEVNSSGDTTWRAVGTDSDGRRIVAVVVANEDDHEIKVITGWVHRRD